VETRLAAVGDGPIISGVGASGGVAVGRAAFRSESAQRLAASGDPVILMRPDTSTADIAGFAIAAGIVTAVGARTAHAALVARQLGKPCVVGCSSMSVDAAADRAKLAGKAISEGDWISIDGDSGHVYQGQREIVVTQPEAELAEVARWRSQSLHPGHSKAKSSHAHLDG
jgi:pyruvate,orthophosphate dikinase